MPIPPAEKKSDHMSAAFPSAERRRREHELLEARRMPRAMK